MLALACLLASHGALAADPAGAEAVEEEAAAVEPEVTFRPLQVAGLVTGGLGVVMLGVSGVFGVQATNLNEESKVAGICDPDGNCSDAGFGKRNDAIDASQVATWTLLAGGALTAVGVTLFLVGGSTAGVGAEPVLSPSEAGMRIRGWF